MLETHVRTLTYVQEKTMAQNGITSGNAQDIKPRLNTQSNHIFDLHQKCNFNQ